MYQFVVCRFSISFSMNYLHSLDNELANAYNLGQDVADKHFCELRTSLKLEVVECLCQSWFPAYFYICSQFQQAHLDCMNQDLVLYF